MIPAENFLQDAINSLIGRDWVFGRRDFLGKRHQNTRQSLAIAPADLESPKGLGFGAGLGLGSGWSGST